MKNITEIVVEREFLDDDEDYVHQVEATQRNLCKGMQYLDCGSFATVYGSPKSKYVVKQGDVVDKYFQYAMYIVRNNIVNPFIPKIKNITIVWDGRGMHRDGTYFVTMERLKKLRQKTSNTVDSDDRYNTTFSEYKRIITSERRWTGKVATNLKQFTKIISYLKSKHGAWDDIHSGNIMLRGKQLVFTDPLQ